MTPGVGLVWYLVRREWRDLGLAIAATLVVAGVSFIVAPSLWLDWGRLLLQAGGADTLQKEPILTLPFLARLPIALVLIVWGARSDRYWTVPIGVMLALPAIRLGEFAVAIGAVTFLVGESPRAHRVIPAPLRRLWGVTVRERRSNPRSPP